MQVLAWHNVGGPQTPQSIMRLRRQMMDACLRLGQPVVTRHMWNRDDVTAGLAKQCPACYDPAYDQTRFDCPVCFGQGFVSTENNTQGLYINTQGRIVMGDPGTGVIAPRYGGFAEPYQTWLIEPDVAVDVFRLDDQGVMIRTYDAQGVAPWYPTLGDNDLCTNITTDPMSGAVLSIGDRFQLKMVQQVTIRGFGSQPRHLPSSQPHLVQQTFRMEKLPLENILYAVPVAELQPRSTIPARARIV